MWIPELQRSGWRWESIFKMHLGKICSELPPNNWKTKLWKQPILWVRSAHLIIHLLLHLVATYTGISCDPALVIPRLTSQVNSPLCSVLQVTDSLILWLPCFIWLLNPLALIDFSEWEAKAGDQRMGGIWVVIPSIPLCCASLTRAAFPHLQPQVLGDIPSQWL